MELLDRIKYDGPADALVWKYGKENIVFGSQLIVNQSQEALFFKNGQVFDIFGPGVYTLSTMNIPLLQTILNLPFDGKTPFSAEVFFVNKVSRLDYKWGTKSPIQVEDPKYRVLVSVGAFGQFGLRVKDSQMLVTNIVGTLPTEEKGVQTPEWKRTWDSNKILDYFRGLVLTRVTDNIAKFLVQKSISIVELSAYLDELSKVAESAIKDEFARFGLDLINFFIASISIPPDEIRRIQKGQFERLEIEQLGDERFQRMRTLEVMEAAASNPGAPGTLVSGGLGLGMGMQMMKQAENISQQDASKTAIPPEQSTVECPKCRSKSPVGSKFCGQCGGELTAGKCSSCGAVMSIDSKFCNQCGKAATATKCTNCGSNNEALAKFCSKCGQTL